MNPERALGWSGLLTAVAALGMVAWHAAGVDESEQVGMPSLEAIEERITNLEMGWKHSDLDVQRDRAAVEQPTRKAAGHVDVADLRVQVAELHDKLTALENAQSELRNLLEDPPPRIPLNRAELGAVVARMSAGEATLVDDFFLWTPHAIYKKFGAPSRVLTAGPSKIEWLYRYSPAGSVAFIFTGQLVTEVVDRRQ